MSPVSVLVADDSAFMRKVISEIISADPSLVVVGAARDGADAIAKARALKPDVVTLDVEMPVMDGLAALPALAGELGVAVVMLSSLTQSGADTTLKAMQLGAVDFVPKPSGAISLNMSAVESELRKKIHAAAQVGAARVKSLASEVRLPSLPPTAPAAHGALPGAPPAEGRKASRRVVVIGTSTGGPRALTEVVPWLPPNLPAGVLIVQHMPQGFTASLARRLDSLSRIRVTEAAGGEMIEDGMALLAPGGRHMEVSPEGRVRLSDGPAVHGVRPAVDVTLGSAVDRFGSGAVGVIMTGMGTDGADSMVKLKAVGGRTVVEHESTCVVYGMPKAVVDRGAADKVVPLPKIADEIIDSLLSL